MNRRNALKGIGLSLGYIVATPAVISLLQSCSNDPQVNWQPVFFNKEEGFVMQKLVDLILPKTEKYPGAVDLGIPQFIDAYLKEVADKKQQDHMKNGFSEILPIVKGSSDEDYHKLLTKFLKATPEEKEAFKKSKKDNLIFGLLSDLRTSVVWAYKNTGEVGKEILAYDPIPGKYEGCITVEEATGGKAWAL
jgi:hypothetical protein